MYKKSWLTEKVKEAYRPLDSVEISSPENGSNLGIFVDVNAAAWCILRKVEGLFPKTKGTSVEAGIFGDKTLLKRRIVRSMRVAGRAEEKSILRRAIGYRSKKKSVIVSYRHVTCHSNHFRSPLGHSEERLLRKKIK